MVRPAAEGVGKPPAHSGVGVRPVTRSRQAVAPGALRGASGAHPRHATAAPRPTAGGGRTLIRFAKCPGPFSRQSYIGGHSASSCRATVRRCLEDCSHGRQPQPSLGGISSRPNRHLYPPLQNDEFTLLGIFHRLIFMIRSSDRS